jgi:hypothetical protein
MLARDQIRAIARELNRTADERIRTSDSRHAEREAMWEAVRRACRAIEVVAELEHDDITPEDRSRKARYMVSELETALEAAKKARSTIEWTVPRLRDA